MQKKTVFILQENKDQIQELKTGLEQTGEFEVVGSATDGISAITLITDLKPKFLITGLVLSGYDGLLVVSNTESDTTERLYFHFSLSCIGKGNATHSSVLAWRIPGTGEPGGLPSMGSHSVGHD